MQKTNPFGRSEFWLSIVGMVGGLLIGSYPDNVYSQAIGGILAAVCGASYTLGRSYKKSRVESAESHARVLAETMLKKKSSG
jgi:hypothetical protein